MNAQSKIEAPTGLALLRQPFAANQISKLPKETKAQADQRKKDQDAGKWPAKCSVCGGLHHPRAVHLDYVGHAALTDRLLEADPAWNWEPVAFADNGLPAFDGVGGLWIRLTVCGQTRLGYGHAEGKRGGDAIKEVIGDALRNAAMRFGAALDLWHKGDLHADEDDAPAQKHERSEAKADEMPAAEWSKMVNLAKASGTSSDELCRKFEVKNLRTINQQQYAEAIELMNDRLAEKAKAETNQQTGDAFGLDDSIGF